ncbi:hypothetical protein [Microtetraspora malaysiensis]|uniref:hypothetical protein n=1 Tax=Microtetraspora malaysiensis TaxID=161358 RepID=UPI000B019738|nr:hypothetical protein [Microtetraspora malaysiensis]
MPPWKLPADPVKGAREAGLSVQPMEGAVKHFHSHMDIIVNGKPIPVAADLGISTAEQVMSELHTHDASGVIHIEAFTTDKRYTLGQLFKEWEVRLDSTHLGGLTAGGKNVLRAYVNGDQVHGDPRTIELLPRQEIALVYGPAGERVDVPSTYTFPADLGEVLPAG